jgi:hypothetical protein
MATILNTQDSRLSADLPRVGTSSVTISGTAGGFMKPTDVVALLPASITLTRFITNYSGTASTNSLWEYSLSKYLDCCR